MKERIEQIEKELIATNAKYDVLLEVLKRSSNVEDIRNNNITRDLPKELQIVGRLLLKADREINELNCELQVLLWDKNET